MFAIQKKSHALLRILHLTAALLAAILTCSTPAAAAGDVKTSHEARTLKITVLVTNMGTRFSTIRALTTADAGSIFPTPTGTTWK